MILFAFHVTLLSQQLKWYVSKAKDCDVFVTVIAILACICPTKQDHIS